MLEIPKAHTPKRKDETSLNVTVTKVEKRCEMTARLNPKQFLQTGESYPRKLSYSDQFYKKRFNKQARDSRLYGFPCQRKPWCNSKLKVDVLSDKPENDGRNINIIQYLGIAADEPERIKRHEKKKNIELPLVQIGWSEAQAKQWCIDNDLLSPIYTDTCLRGGCWFCHNQTVQSMRELRHNYPDLWTLFLKWDNDSPVTFKADGRTVHDYDRRFAMEDEGKWRKEVTNFKWKWLDDPPPVEKQKYKEIAK